MEILDNSDQFGMDQIEKKSFDNFFLGLFLSVLMTLIVMSLLAGRAFSFGNLEESLIKVYHSSNFPNYMIASLFPSMFVFFFFYKTERWQSAKGLIVSVLLSMVLIVI
ncbi:MAG: hypothetical protein MJZ34_10880 [Paludibacteraceae bacterium]|nr:hypothetical protein [Paludibacteraceae bacterium]